MATRAHYSGVLARGGKVLGRVAASLPLPAASTQVPSEPVLRAPRPRGRRGERPWVSDSSSPIPFSRALQVSGLWTWALWEGARQQHLGNPNSAKGQPPTAARLRSCQRVVWTQSQLSVAVVGVVALPRRITSLAPPCTWGQWSRPRKLSARPRLPAPGVTQQRHSAPAAEGRLFISQQATG